MRTKFIIRILKPIKFDRFKAESEDNVFAFDTAAEDKATDAIGIASKPRRYGGTLMLIRNIAFELLYI